MILDWIGKAITTISAFFASDAFVFALLWLIVPYLVAWARCCAAIGRGRLPAGC